MQRPLTGEYDASSDASSSHNAIENTSDATCSSANASGDIAKSDAKLVRKSKFLILVVLGLLALACAFGVFKVASGHQEDSFQQMVSKPSRSASGCL